MCRRTKDLQFDSYIRSVSTHEVYQNLNVDYCSENEFNEKYGKLSSENIALSIFHLNIRNLNANSSKLVQLLHIIDLKFDVIVLSEIWTYNIQFYSNILDNYVLIHDLPSDTKIGEVGIFISNKLKYRLCPDLYITGTKMCKV